jgi:hypothetical protein
LLKKLEIVCLTTVRIKNFCAVTQETALMQASALTVATSKSKDVVNTVGTPAKAGTLSKVVKPTTACRKAN